MSVERVFGRLKEHFMLETPRVRHEDPVKQHVFLSLCALVLVAIATENMGYGPLKSSIFRL